MKTIQNLLLLILLTAILQNGFAQETDNSVKLIDSMLSVLPSQKGEIQFMSYIRLNTLYGRKDPKKGKLYLDKAKELAKKIDDNKLLGLVVHQMANYHQSISQFEKAEKLYLEAIEMYNDAAYTYEMPLVYNSLGITLKNLGKTSQAIKAYEKALEYNESENYEKGNLVVYSNLGVLYAKMGNLKVSNAYYEKVEKIALEKNDKFQVALARSNRATNLVDSKSYEVALKMYFDAIPIFEEQGRKLVLGEQYYLIGSAYLAMDSLQKALEHLEKSIVLSNETGETAMLGMANRKMGEVFFKQGNFHTALKQFQKSLKISKETSNNIEIADDYLNLSKTYEQLGDLPKAYENHKLFFTVHDSVFSTESNQKLNELEIKFKTEKNLQEISLQKKEIELLEEKQHTAYLQRTGLIIGLLTTILLFGLIYYIIHQKLKRNKLIKEKMESELSFKTKELTTHALHLAKKNEVLNDLKQKAKVLKADANADPGYQMLIQTINFDLQDDNNWENFSRYFEQVHKGFNEKAQEQFPAITNNDLRLMALLKMNLSSKEIANILNISSDGIKKARQRLRKKMGIDSNVSLEATVISI